jgi:hypothetical protein
MHGSCKWPFSVRILRQNTVCIVFFPSHAPRPSLAKTSHAFKLCITPIRGTVNQTTKQRTNKFPSNDVLPEELIFARLLKILIALYGVQYHHRVQKRPSQLPILS